jgi:hypothetical protein
MAYGIGLVFDPHTEAHIREVWCRLASHGFTTPLARPGCLPHVSLLLSETLRVDELARSQSGVWVPHCTLATRVDASRLSDAIADAATCTLPWVATQVRLVIVQFDPGCVELLRVFPWQGSPVRRRRSPVCRAGDGLSGGSYA